MFIGNAHHKEGEIPTSSLADIVFLLLIFFLVSTSISVEKGIDLVLPDFEIKTVPPGMVSNILINKMGQIALDGDTISLNQLKSEIKEKLAINPKLIVSLTTDANTDYNMYIKVLDKLKQAWASNPPRISIAEPFE